MRLRKCSGNMPSNRLNGPVPTFHALSRFEDTGEPLGACGLHDRLERVRSCFKPDA